MPALRSQTRLELRNRTIQGYRLPNIKQQKKKILNQIDQIKEEIKEEEIEFVLFPREPLRPQRTPPPRNTHTPPRRSTFSLGSTASDPNNWI
jgi:flagellar biosynthesis/type III secretory pathway chaperone